MRGLIGGSIVGSIVGSIGGSIVSSIGGQSECRLEVLQSEPQLKGR